jgi:hypothetical protein
MSEVRRCTEEVVTSLVVGFVVILGEFCPRQLHAATTSKNEVVRALVIENLSKKNSRFNLKIMPTPRIELGTFRYLVSDIQDLVYPEIQGERINHFAKQA